MSVRKTSPLAVAALLLLICVTFAHGSAHAGDWYLGVSATAERLDADYDRATVNGPGSPRGDGNNFRSDDVSDGTVHGLGVLIGYRMPLGRSGLYLGGELDFAHHGGTVRGYLPEDGDPLAPGRNEYGEGWDEDWSYEKERSYGLTLKLGMPVETWAGAGTSLYVLAGVRRIETYARLSYEGCVDVAVVCNDAGLTPITESRDATVTGWTAGAGFEKALGEDTAFRAEVRYTDHENNRWTYFPAAEDLDRIRLPSAIDGDEFGLSLGLVRYF